MRRAKTNNSERLTAFQKTNPPGTAGTSEELNAKKIENMQIRAGRGQWDTRQGISPWHELFAEEQMSVLAARGRGDLFVERKNNLLIWLMHQNLKFHPQRHKSLAFLLTGAGRKAQQKQDGGSATTQGTLRGAQSCSMPHSPAPARAQTKKKT